MVRVVPRSASQAAAQQEPLPSGASDLLYDAVGGRRVLLLNGSPSLRAALEGTASNVVVSELSREEAHPGISAVSDNTQVDVVVLGEGLATVRDPAAALTAVARSSGGRPLLLAFRNRACAAALVGTLLGTRDAEGLVPATVERWVTAAGLVVKARTGVQADPPQLAPDAAHRVRAALEALSPDAEMGFVLWTLAEGEITTRIPGLLSVVVRTHDPARLNLLDHAVFSLACQRWRPLEIVLAIQPRDGDHAAAAERVLARHQALGGYTFQVAELQDEGDQRGRLVNIGIAAAQGQYLAFLDDDDVVYPLHYSRLIEAIRSGPHGWAVSRARLARFSRVRENELYCTEKTLFPGPQDFDLPRLIRSNYIPNHAYVLDRDRLGALPISFSESVTRAEDYELLLRLAGTFRPAWLPEPGCEYRLRDDGTNVNPMADAPEAKRASEALQWRSSDEAREAMKARWPVLFTISELERETERWSLPPLPSPDRPLRHHVADAANEVIKRFAPVLHSSLKRWVRRAILRLR